ncbi:PREDICTED: protein FAR1-RELATED SEQUENCE 5-like [Ipomoea nil]|uniref:protein FAR1-RELATED SEQUENCE 5-like n=1 Tax=Ipomoea nil TaxID=35883 RepID=UPI0009009A46|nr:PREDICTED: protein FAR1-RELATED SEQUENCE 5-like [Ipomoea nil]
MRINRKLDVAQQAFLANCVKANVSGSKSFRLCKEAAGSFADVGATEMEFHNFKRDLQQYVDAKDGEMIIAKFKQKREVCEEFYFDYHLDDEAHLARIFWADHTCRLSFTSFVDVISFDAPYSTNRYNLVFVPFTGVDSHKRCITFDAAMITRKDTESYVWVLDRFKDAMGKSLMYVVTDQDPAMKAAIARVLPETRHRYCMWHIMTKVSEKLGSTLAQNETFRNKLNDIVWGEAITIGEFEAQWHSLMEEHNLTRHRWFCKLYTEWEFWIPAYFLDLPMGGLLRTTSRSEATNSVYGKSTRTYCSLVEFYMQYKSILETQRHTQNKLNSGSEGSLPEFKTPLAIERHMAQVFTLRIFYELQKEIESACFYSGVVGIRKDNGLVHYNIKGSYSVTHTLEFNLTVVSSPCSCKLFERLGLVCEHMFSVFRAAQVKSLPSDCIAPRWCKHIRLSCYCVKRSDCLSVDHAPNRLWTEIHSCLAIAGSNTTRQRLMSQVLQDLTSEFLCDGMGDEHAKGNRGAIAALCSVESPASITIKPRAQAKNKGTAKRIKSQRELATERSAKEGRKCGMCGEYAHHNARSCPLK